MQFCASRKRLALTESLFFWRLKSLDFLHFAVFVLFLIDCDGDETVLFKFIITWTGLWLTCFMILFLYTRLWVFRGCSWLACYYCFQKDMQFCTSRKRLALTESWFFWRPKNLDFLYFAVSVPCFIRLRLWWNWASWIGDKKHSAPIDLFCDTFLYTSLLSFPRLLSTGLLLLLSKRHAILCFKETLGFDWVFVFWRPKNLDFRYFAVSLPCFNRLRLWWNCAFWIDDNMHWALIDSFLWYSFCIHDYSFICGCFLMACYYCFQKA